MRRRSYSVDDGGREPTRNEGGEVYDLCGRVLSLLF